MRAAALLVLFVGQSLLFAQDAAKNPYEFNPLNTGSVVRWTKKDGKTLLTVYACGMKKSGLECGQNPTLLFEDSALPPRLRAIRKPPDMTFCNWNYLNPKVQFSAPNPAALKPGMSGSPGMITLNCSTGQPGFRVLVWWDFPEDVVFPAADALEEERRVQSYYTRQLTGVDPISTRKN